MSEDRATLQTALAAFEAGRTADAATGFEQILQRDPETAEAHYFLAVIAYQAGQQAAALSSIAEAVRLRPDAADCHNLHGLVLLETDRASEAVSALQQAHACDRSLPDPCNNLAAAHEALGALQDAETFYRKALSIDAGYAQAHSNLGRILLATGRPGEAETAYRAALSTQPGLSDARLNLAVAQQRQGKLADAEATLEGALEATPGNADLWRFLGALRHSRGDLSGGEQALRQAISLQPSLSEAHDNLAGILLDQSRIDDAEACFQQALALNPEDTRAHSNLLLCRNYYENDPGTLFNAHKAWAAQHPQRGDLLPTRGNKARLRVGYVSGDFRRHAVAFFFEPLLRHRDRTRFETFCYANLQNPDDVTVRLRGLADHWRWVSGLDDDRLAAQIREDQIDILIDLSGHTAGNRLPVFQRRPAPLQASWLGYPNTTGLSAIDYRITDAVADPAGAEQHATETLMRLEGGFLSYRPPDDAPVVAPLPAQRNGFVTFGSFNNLRKVTPQAIETWSQILNAMPTSKLVLKARPFADPMTADRYRDLFAMQGIDEARLMFRGAIAAPAEHLAAYADIDIALDPFPYNGTTTTCEALWMGVAVIALRGNRHASRVGASLLTQTGLNDLICADRPAYVEAAATLAQDIDKLADRRAALRHRIASSSLCDGAGFCRRMEAAFDQMAGRS